MRIILKTLVASAVVIVAAACSAPQEPTAELSADLRKDLELAKATGLELASARQTGNLVVSALEAAPAGHTQEADRAPRAVPRRKAPPAPAPVADPAPEPGEASIASELAEAEAVAEEAPVEVAAAPEEEAIAPEPVAGDEPEVVSGPQVIPQDGPAPVRRPRGGLGDLGGIIGVVVRGGMGGVDDCAIHPRGGGILVGRGFPRSGGTVITRTPVYGSGDAGRGRISSPPRSRGGSSLPTGMGGARGRGRM